MVGMKCPSCESEAIVKNGSIHNGNREYKCKACGRQFVEQPQQKLISAQTKQMINRLLLERIWLAGIVRVTGVSERWLQSYVNGLYAQQPRQSTVTVKKTPFDVAMR